MNPKMLNGLPAMFTLTTDHIIKALQTEDVVFIQTNCEKWGDEWLKIISVQHLSADDVMIITQDETDDKAAIVLKASELNPYKVRFQKLVTFDCQTESLEDNLVHTHV